MNHALHLTALHLTPLGAAAGTAWAEALSAELLLTRTVHPSQKPIDAMLAVVGARPEAADSTCNIRCP